MAEILHRCLCVSNLDLSVAFYREALGFRIDSVLPGLSPLDAPSHNPIVGRSVLRRRDGARLLLTQFRDIGAGSSRTRRSVLDCGLYHLSFYVVDIDDAARAIERAGGCVWGDTRAHYPENATTMLYCTDPDGVRIELMQAPGVAERFSHNGIVVEDIEESIGFYEALGFSRSDNYVFATAAAWQDAINEVPGITLRAQMMTDRSGSTIELLKIFTPPHAITKASKPLNQLGITHLRLHDDQPEHCGAMLSARGCSVTIEGASCIAIDPNGVRLEIVHALP